MSPRIHNSRTQENRFSDGWAKSKTRSLCFVSSFLSFLYVTCTPSRSRLYFSRFAAVMFWLIGFDIIYALQDYEFDRQRGLRSLVVAWGPKNALDAAFISHMIMWGLLFGFGLLCRFRLAYLVGLLIILVNLLLEHWLARRRSLRWINVAFFRLNALISVVFLAVTLAEVAFRGGFRLR